MGSSFPFSPQSTAQCLVSRMAPTQCPVTWRAGHVARGLELFLGRGLQDESLKDVTSNLEEELKEEALSVFLSSVTEGLSIKDCIANVQDQALVKVPNKRNKWFIRFVYDNKLQIEIGVNKFKNGNSQFYHSLGLYSPETEAECPLSDRTPCNCEDEHHRAKVIKELLDRGEMARIQLKKQVSNDRSDPWISDDSTTLFLPPNPTNLQAQRSIDGWDTHTPTYLPDRRNRRWVGGTSGGAGRKARSRSVDGRQAVKPRGGSHSRASSLERQGSKERSASVVGDRRPRPLGDLFRYGCKPSQDRLRPTEDVSWVKSKKRGEGGIFALEKDFEHNALRCKPIRLGMNENIPVKNNETNQNKITKIVFNPGKETKTNSSIVTQDKIQESNKHCNDNWITKCLEMENVENSKKDKTEEETNQEDNSNKDKTKDETNNKENSKKDKTQEEMKFANKDIHNIPLDNLPDKSYTIDINTNAAQNESNLTNGTQTQTKNDASLILLPGGGFRDPAAACTNIPINRTEKRSVCITNGARTETVARDNKESELTNTNGDAIFVDDEDPFHIDESAMEAEKYIIYRQTSQSVLYNMERDDTLEEQEVVKEDTVEETTDHGELFTIREETSYDDLDAVFQKIYERDIYEFNSLDDIKEDKDIEEMKPVFSKPFIPSKPNTPRTPVINKPVINKPVINTPVNKTPVNISTT